MNHETVRLGDIVKCADMKMRRCTHFLDKRVVPLGKQQKMGRGRHRRFDLGQAFNLILAYRLSELGVPLRRLRKIVHTVHKHFDVLKRPVSDGFWPRRGELEFEFHWHFVMSRGEWVVVVPKEYAAAWFTGRVDWYSLSRRKLERPAGTDLALCWLHVPLAPIAECVAGPIMLGLDLLSHDTYNGLTRRFNEP